MTPENNKSTWSDSVEPVKVGQLLPDVSYHFNFSFFYESSVLGTVALRKTTVISETSDCLS